MSDERDSEWRKILETVMASSDALLRDWLEKNTERVMATKLESAMMAAIHRMTTRDANAPCCTTCMGYLDLLERAALKMFLERQAQDALLDAWRRPKDPAEG